jgi:hypothetical protein
VALVLCLAARWSSDPGPSDPVPAIGGLSDPCGDVCGLSDLESSDPCPAVGRVTFVVADWSWHLIAVRRSGLSDP